MATASPCDRCDGRCCHAYVVRVTGYDAWVISSALGLPMEEFLSYLPDPEGNGAGFMLDRSGATYGLALRQRPGERACLFLQTLPDGRGRCSVYAHRPLVCRAFPALLDGRRVALRGELVCPPGSWQASEMALPPWRRQLLALDLERTIHRLVVSRWNERVRGGPADAVRPIHEYLAFLADAYGRIAPLRPAARRQAAAQAPPSWGRHGAPAAGSPRWQKVLERIREALDAS